HAKHDQSLKKTNMAYRKVRAGHGSLRVRDLESEELHTASMELEWDMEKELEEPGLDRFQLECVEHQPVSSSSGGGMDPDLEPIQPSVSPHGRFERLQEDPNYVSRFSRSVPKGQRRNGTCLAKYLLAGMGVFALGLLIGRYAFSKEQVKVEPITTLQIRDLLFLTHTAREVRVYPEPFKNCKYLNIYIYIYLFFFQAEVVDVQYGSPEDLRRVQASANVTNKIALLKLGQFPLLYKLSLLAEVGFGGSLLYVDPCDAPFGNKTFGVTLNPGGNPFPEEDARSAGRDSRHNLTSLLVQPISASLAKMLLSAPAMGQGRPCIPMAMPSCLILVLCVSVPTLFPLVDRYVLVGSRHGSWYEGALADWGNGSAVMTQIIASMTAQTRAGWQPDRTIVFCSWGGTSLGNIGSFEWGKENAVVLQSRAVAYVSLHSPVRAPGSLQATASPSLLQLRHPMSCSRGGGCPDPNVSSLQTPGDLSFFSNQLAVPTVEFTYSEFPKTEVHEHTHAYVCNLTEAILRLATDPVLPFYPLDIVLDVQKKLKDDPLMRPDLLNVAATLRDNSAFFQSEVMRPANDPKERDPAHLRMLNDVLRDLEKSFLIPNPPPGFSRNQKFVVKLDNFSTSHSRPAVYT
uniref:N-acetylated alpha-linked acidic dipeptidase like 2 n=1 Tax=Sinocyclocheilus grahami TaxID=75366 RepID=A0A672P8S4_SINGR